MINLPGYLKSYFLGTKYFLSRKSYSTDHFNLDLKLIHFLKANFIHKDHGFIIQRKINFYRKLNCLTQSYFSRKSLVLPIV